MYLVVSFCRTKGHVHVLVQVPKDFNVIVLKPLAEWPFSSPRALLRREAVQQITVFLFWEIL